MFLDTFAPMLNNSTRHAFLLYSLALPPLVRIVSPLASEYIIKKLVHGGGRDLWVE